MPCCRVARWVVSCNCGAEEYSVFRITGCRSCGKWTKKAIYTRCPKHGYQKHPLEAEIHTEKETQDALF